MIDDAENVKEFQRRRQWTWHAAKVWLVMAAVGMIGLFLIGDLDFSSSHRQWVAEFFFLALLGVSMIRIFFIVRSSYRCPACDAIPMSGGFLLGPSTIDYERGVDFNPEQCYSCGIRLKNR